MQTNPQLIDYIKDQVAKKVERDVIEKSLLNVGWTTQAVSQAFLELDQINTQSSPSIQQPVVNNKTNSNLPQSTMLGMSSRFDNKISEEDYAISTVWIFKYPIIMVVLSIVAWFFGYWFPYFVVAIPYFLIANPLQRKNFHYSFEDKYLLIEQGVLSKKQRNLPYNVIQNVFVKQDLFDRLFGISNLILENASEGGGKGRFSKWVSNSGNKERDFIGSKGNKVSVPGLKKAHAEVLRDEILKKVKENPLEDSQSGL